MFRSSHFWAREMARREAAWAEERRQLVDTICHLAGKPWTLPPSWDADTAEAEAEVFVSALDGLPPGYEGDE